MFCTIFLSISDVFIFFSVTFFLLRDLFSFFSKLGFNSINAPFLYKGDVFLFIALTYSVSFLTPQGNLIEILFLNLNYTFISCRLLLKFILTYFVKKNLILMSLKQRKFLFENAGKYTFILFSVKIK